ncbi:MAG: hypothetical protein H0U27_08040 [Nitrosopumilus sp.]|nr:hypothetical protein [Nitrosopumilus sp.]
MDKLYNQIEAIIKTNCNLRELEQRVKFGLIKMKMINGKKYYLIRTGNN